MGVGLELCVLASGSSANCAAIRCGGGVMLVDAGIGPRALAGRMKGSGVTAGEVGAICLTHLDRDHFNHNWFADLERRRIPVFCHERAAGRLSAMAKEAGRSAPIRTFDADSFEPLPGLRCRPIAFSHDEAGSHGFRIEAGGGRIGYATDLGHVPDALIEAMAGVEVMAIESNYDPHMQIESGRPLFLQRRIMGGSGHLSNQQAYDAVRRVMNRCGSMGVAPPRRVALLHRSRQCNSPQCIHRTFGRDPRLAGRLVLAEQDERTEWLSAGRHVALVGEQLTLAWGT